MALDAAALQNRTRRDRVIGMARVLTIAGVDPTGRAGIAADLRAFFAHGCDGASAVAVLTVQGPGLAPRTHPVDPAWLRDTIHAALATGDIAAIKTGALGSAGNVEAVVSCLANHPHIPLVVDPIAATTSGGQLLDDEGWRALTEVLLPRATVITPNIPETERMVGRAITSVADMEDAARELSDRGPHVLVTGGHLPGDGPLVDVVCSPVTAGSPWRCERLESRRLNVSPTALRGTGCRLSAAIAAQLAWDHGVVEAIAAAKRWLQDDLAAAAGPSQSD